MGDAEQQTTSTEEEKKIQPSSVAVEDVGTWKKKVRIEVAGRDVKDRYEDAFAEFSGEYAHPGFRKGRAPRRIVERKFGKEVAKDLKGKVVSEAVEAAFEKETIKPLGSPELDLEKIEFDVEKLVGDSPDPLAFELTVEVQPEFELPEYSEFFVTVPEEPISDEDVEKGLKELAKRMANIVPVVSGESELDDTIEAGCVVKVEGNEVWSEKELSVLAESPEAIGLPFVLDGKELVGLAPGGTKEISIEQLPDFFPFLY